MALNRVVTHLEDELTATVADRAARTGVSFDEALALYIMTAEQIFEASEAEEFERQAIDVLPPTGN